jgi:hypothetical protein
VGHPAVVHASHILLKEEGFEESVHHEVSFAEEGASEGRLIPILREERHEIRV